MFERFRAAFRLLPPDQTPGPVWADDRLISANGYAELAGMFAGCSFENGLYRLHDASSGPRAAAQIAEAFPDFATHAVPFGYDWLGRAFAVDLNRADGSEPLVLLLEPGTGEALEVPGPF